MGKSITTFEKFWAFPHRVLLIEGLFEVFLILCWHQLKYGATIDLKNISIFKKSLQVSFLTFHFNWSFEAYAASSYIKKNALNICYLFVTLTFQITFLIVYSNRNSGYLNQYLVLYDLCHVSLLGLLIVFPVSWPSLTHCARIHTQWVIILKIPPLEQPPPPPLPPPPPKVSQRLELRIEKYNTISKCLLMVSMTEFSDKFISCFL